MDILLTVNFADAQVIIKGKLYKVKRGQSILSYESWGKRWNWDKSKVRRFMSLLQKDAMIDIKSDNITTHITVCKFDSYQDKRHADETQTKRKRNADEIQTTPIEEEEEQKEEEKEKDVFEELWALYTRRGNKVKSIECFNNLKKSEISAAAEHIPKYIQHHIDNDKMDYLPHFTTYLRGKRWNDVLPYKNGVAKERFQLRNIATLDDD